MGKPIREVSASTRGGLFAIKNMKDLSSFRPVLLVLWAISFIAPFFLFSWWSAILILALLFLAPGALLAVALTKHNFSRLGATNQLVRATRLCGTVRKELLPRHASVLAAEDQSHGLKEYNPRLA